MSAPPALAGNSSAVLPQDLGAEAAHVLLAVNPKAGSGRFVHLLESLQEKLVTAGFVVHRCTDVATLQSQAKALAEQGKLRVVIVAGGDGSARLIAESLPANTPLMILPLGTENLLARHLGYSRDPDAMVEIVKNGQPTTMD
ncbi:MAG: acylglycerol kinase family protein, partial [Pirellulales bacterium]